MKSAFFNYGYDISNLQAEKFSAYYELLTFYNKKFNITAITEKEEVIKKHFIDSIYPYKYIKNGKLIDVGAGGGFPSVPLKIMNEELDLTLLEATGKKCEFLKTLVKELKLDCADVINERAEILAKDFKFREKYDYAVSRAVAGLNTLSEYCLPFVKKGGEFIAYKGDVKEEIKQGENAVKILGGKIEKLENYELFGAKRTLIYIKKIYSTDKKYPRGNGKERKNPL